VNECAATNIASHALIVARKCKARSNLESRYRHLIDAMLVALVLYRRVQLYNLGGSVPSLTLPFSLTPLSLSFPFSLLPSSHRFHCLSLPVCLLLKIYFHYVYVAKFVHEFRATTLECSAGQCEVELLLTPFHNHDIRCVEQFHK